MLLIGLWAVAIPLFARQDAAGSTAASTQAPAVEEGKLYLAPLPVLAANPAFGFIYVDPAAGLGLCIMINKQARTSLTLDYAWGKYGAGAFYLNLNETF